MSEDPVVDESMTEAEKKRYEEWVAKRAKTYFAKHGLQGVHISGGTNDPVTRALNKALKSARIRNVN